MKRKHKNTKINPSEETELLRHLCRELNEVEAGNIHHLLASDTLECERCEVITLNETINDELEDEYSDVEEDSIIGISSDDLSQDQDWIKLQYNEELAFRGFMLKPHVVENELVELRRDYLSIKRCFACSNYQATSNFLPIEADPNNCAIEVELHKTPLGDIVYWGATNWFLITDIDHEDYMSDVRDSMVFVYPKGCNKAKLAVFLGGDYESEFCEEFFEITTAKDFFTPEVLMWAQSKLTELQQGIRGKRKSML